MGTRKRQRFYSDLWAIKVRHAAADPVMSHDEDSFIDGVVLLFLPVCLHSTCTGSSGLT